MRIIQSFIDSMIDCISPNAIAGWCGEWISRDQAVRLHSHMKYLVRLFLVLCDVGLVMDLASCDREVYTGVDIIRETATLGVTHYDHWAAVALTLTSLMVLAAFFISVIRKTPFYILCRITSCNALLITAVIVFYRVIKKFYTSDTIGVIRLKKGAYLLLILYLLTMAAAMAGRACEAAMGLWRKRRYLYQQQLFLTSVVLAAVPLAIEGFLAYKVDNSNLHYLILAALGLNVVQEFLILMKSEHAGSFAVLKNEVDLYLAYMLAVEKELPATGILVYLFYAIGMLVLLNWSAGKGREDIQVYEETMTENGSCFCSECGTHLDADTSFCPNCGKKKE